ncbi:MAG: hypothetical protein AAF721_22970 [Myxococcota bacterium]
MHATAAIDAPAAVAQWVVPAGMTAMRPVAEPDPEDVTAVWRSRPSTPPQPRIVENMPQCIPANDVSPDFHWARPAFAPVGESLRGVPAASESAVMEIGDLALTPREDKEHLLTTATPVGLLPAATLFFVMAGSLVAFGGRALQLAQSLLAFL